VLRGSAVRIGPSEVTPVLDGVFSLDGGAMFGIVPRAIWERGDPPDPENRIVLALRCLLVQVDGRTILVDTGIGDKWSARDVARYAIAREGQGLVGALNAHGISREDVTDVILTHLHFDHAGGVTRRGEGGALELTFPKARHFLQRRNLMHALHPTVRDRGSYLEENFALLARSKRLELLDGPAELAPGVEVVLFEGHTVGQQLVRIRDPLAPRRGWILYGADIIPTSSHLSSAFVMGYDLSPDVTAREKARALARAAEEGGIVVFEHDPRIAAAMITFDEKGRPMPQPMDLLF
jgi:glyoxylase-like metal-dependent hydrolase (beta-lactamase superfamily II)